LQSALLVVVVDALDDVEVLGDAGVQLVLSEPYEPVLDELALGSAGVLVVALGLDDVVLGVELDGEELVLPDICANAGAAAIKATLNAMRVCLFIRFILGSV
jgi:hypothetical protein